MHEFSAVFVLSNDRTLNGALEDRRASLLLPRKSFLNVISSSGQGIKRNFAFLDTLMPNPTKFFSYTTYVARIKEGLNFEIEPGYVESILYSTVQCM